MRPLDITQDLVRRAGDHDIWFVYTEGTQPMQTKCGQIADALSVIRPRVSPVEPDPFFFEHQGLYRYLPPRAEAPSLVSGAHRAPWEGQRTPRNGAGLRRRGRRRP